MSLIKNSVKGDRKSILSGTGSCVSETGSDLNSRGSTLIDNVRIQEKIMKNSMKLIVPKGSWYPNQKLKSTFSSKFSGSPQPKKVSGMNFRIKNSIYGDFGQRSSQASSFMIAPQAVQTGDLNGLIDQNALNGLSAVK